MAKFVKRIVTDQVVQYPNRFKIDGVSHTIQPDFGTISAAGTQINKSYLQPIEDYLDDGVVHADLGQIIDLTTAMTPGVGWYVDSNNYFGFAGAKYNVEISVTDHGSGNKSVVQRLTMTSPAPQKAINQWQRAYHTSTGWTNWAATYPSLAVVSVGIDYNSLTNEGVYRVYNGTNAPYSDGNNDCFVMVFKAHNEDHLRQTAFDLRSNAVYTRSCAVGIFSGWSQVHTTQNLPFPANFRTATYVGTDSSTLVLNFGFVPRMIFIFGYGMAVLYRTGESNGIGTYHIGSSSQGHESPTFTISGTQITVSGAYNFNYSGWTWQCVLIDW